jgi:hypothetical protein
MSDVSQNCLRADRIFSYMFNENGPVILFNRLILSAFMHADDLHLYYNMNSLCMKRLFLLENVC